ncbi:MAG: helix-turn-helix domain-containing protein [Deltaproteobacteria bacterium]|nr:helix-turn-helix domain-containing protein [Deltaproteobacteria bacterium]
MKGKELKNWRKKYNLTQLELSRYLNVERVTVARWEVGIRTISPFLFLALEALENRLTKGGGKGKGKTRKTNPKRKEVKKHEKSLSKR